MKKIIFFLVTMFSYSSFAGCNREAQFIGTVKNVKAHPTYVSYQIKLGYKGNYWFQTNPLCALWEDEVEAATIIESGNSKKKNGDQVSGTLVVDDSNHIYKIE